MLRLTWFRKALIVVGKQTGDDARVLVERSTLLGADGSAAVRRRYNETRHGPKMGAYTEPELN